MISFYKFKQSLSNWNGSVNLSELEKIYSNEIISECIKDCKTVDESLRKIINDISDDDFVILAKPKRPLYQEDVNELRQCVYEKTFSLNENVLNVRKNIGDFTNSKIEFIFGNGDRVLIDEETIKNLKDNNIDEKDIHSKKELFSVISEILED